LKTILTAAVTGNKVNYTPTGSGNGIKSIKKRMVDYKVFVE